MKKRLLSMLLALTVSICALAGCADGDSWRTDERETDYRKSIEYIEAEQFDEATHILNGTEYFSYKDGGTLYYYALAQNAYRNKPKKYEYFTWIKSYLRNIPVDYDGAFKEDIAEFREMFQAEYDRDIASLKAEYDEYQAAHATPKPTATPKPSSGGTYSYGGHSSGGDEYNSDEYSHPDDFYYDHYDDFVDYDEARDYWDEYN